MAIRESKPLSYNYQFINSLPILIERQKSQSTDSGASSMDIQYLGGTFASNLNDVWVAFINFTPRFLVAVILFVIGWIVGSVIGKALAQVISALKIDKALESAGVDEIMEKAGLKLNVGGFIGGVVKWFIVAVFLLVSLNILQLTEVTAFVRTDIIGYLPQVIKAALVLIIGAVLADFMGKVVGSSARASGFRAASFLGTMVRYSIWIFTFIITLSELRIADDYMRTIFVGLVAMLSLAGGLAFGLGGKEAAARALDKVREHTTK